MTTIQRNTSSRVSLHDGALLAFLLTFAVFEVFGGALRYYLTIVGVPWLIYLPKLLMAAALVGALVKLSYSARISRVVLGAFALFAAFLIIGAWFTRSWIQPTVGAFVLLPLVFAVLVEPAFTRFGERILPYVAALWFGAAVGVAIDYFTQFAWSGFAYEVGGAEVSASRSWTTFGIERVAGFSRASYEVAAQLLFLALPLLILGRKKSLKKMIWLVTGVLILITTTKKTIGVYLFLTLLWPLMTAGLFPNSLKRMAGIAGPWLTVAVGIFLPLSTLFIKYRVDLDSFFSKALFASFEDRLTWAWPDAFSLVLDHGNVLLGRGLGGIGPAQTYYEPLLYTPGDSLYLFLYATFGVIAIPLIFAYTSNVTKLNPASRGWTSLLWFFSISVLMSGWAANAITGGLTACIFGITLRYAANHHRAQIRGARSHYSARVFHQRAFNSREPFGKRI